MVKLFLVICFFSLAALAQGNSFNLESKIPQLTVKLQKLKLEQEPLFEESFNQVVKELDQTLEKEKNICTGELSSEQGQVVAKEERQVCLRTIKGHYLAALNEIHLLKKKYMALIHQRQMSQLDESFEKLKAQFEKKF